MSRYYLLIFSGAALLACAVFDFAWRTSALTALLLFLPLLDYKFHLPHANSYNKKWPLRLIILIANITFVALYPAFLQVAAITLILVALPEEWFFRAWFMSRLAMSCKPHTANIMTSLLFTSLHIPTQGFMGICVFFPSLFFGWLYQRNNDLILSVLVHTLFNLIFFIFVKNSLPYYLDKFNI